MNALSPGFARCPRSQHAVRCTRLSPLVLTAMILAAAAPSRAEAPLTVDAAVTLALQHSKGTQIAEFKSAAATATESAARRQGLPRVEAFGISGYYFRPLDLQLRQGALTPLLDNAGRVLGLGQLSATLGPFPGSDLTLVRGSRFESMAGLTVLQPLTQLWRVDSGVRAARAETTVAQHESAATASQVRLAVEQLFAGMMVEDARQAQLRARVAWAERQRRDAENAATVGESLDDAVLGLRAALIEARSDLMRSEQQRARLALQLGDLIGRPGEEGFAVNSSLPARPEHPLEYWLAKSRLNPAARIAAATAERARAGTRAARQAYIPELSAYATAYAQDGLPLLPAHGGTVGLTMRWDVFDFGRRRADIARSTALQRAAELDRDRREEDAAREVRTTYQDFTYAGQLVALAEQAVAYRQRAAELARQSTQQGLTLESKALELEAELRKAEADLIAARVQRHLALLRLYVLVGE